jgi:hypothetical protein
VPRKPKPTDERLAEVLASSRTEGLVAKARTLGVGVRTLVRELTSAVWGAARRRLDAYLLSRAARIYEVLADRAEEGDYKAIQLFLKEFEAAFERARQPGGGEGAVEIVTEVVPPENTHKNKRRNAKAKS